MFLSMVWIFFSFFKKKLIVLLSLEGMILSLISMFQVSNLISFSSFFFLTVFSVFMVLDSVFGISLLISFSRSSMNYFKIFS